MRGWFHRCWISLWMCTLITYLTARIQSSHAKSKVQCASGPVARYEIPTNNPVWHVIQKVTVSPGITNISCVIATSGWPADTCLLVHVATLILNGQLETTAMQRYLNSVQAVSMQNDTQMDAREVYQVLVCLPRLQHPRYSLCLNTWP